LSDLDFVTGSQHSFLNPCPVQECAVGAFLVRDAAAVRAAFHGEVHAGHVIVMRNCKLGAVGRSADNKRLSICDRDFFTNEWTRLDFKDQSHELPLHSCGVQVDLTHFSRRSRQCGLC
jgi:hypothetical protein